MMVNVLFAQWKSTLCPNWIKLADGIFRTSPLLISPSDSPHIDPHAADRILHGELTDGSMIYGLDVTRTAWQLVGKGHWFAFLRWPLIRPIADLAYHFFARHRHHISGWFGRTELCDERCRKP